MTLETAAYSAAVLFVAYLVRGIAGFGSGLIAVPLLTLFSPITVVVPVVVSLDYIGSASPTSRSLPLVGVGLYAGGHAHTGLHNRDFVRIVGLLLIAAGVALMLRF